MDTKKDNLREILMLCLLALSPVLIGYLFNVILYIPVIGKIWMYAAPFTMLYFWGWVGSVFVGRMKAVWKSVLLGNLAGILSLILFTALGQSGAEGSVVYILSAVAQMFTLPLGFLTMWIPVAVEGINDLGEASWSVMILTQAVGTLMMMAAFLIGCLVGKKRAA